MSVVTFPQWEEEGQELFRHLVEDPAVVSQPLGSHDLGHVVQEEEGAVLLQHQLLSLEGVHAARRAGAGLDAGLKDGEQLGPLLGHVEAGDLAHYHGQLEGNRIRPGYKENAALSFKFYTVKIHKKNFTLLLLDIL